MGKFSKKARRKAKVSRVRTERMMASAKHRAGPVRVTYLPGYETTGPSQRTRFPFRATINGREAIVSRNAYGIQFDYPTGGTDDRQEEGLQL